MALGCLLAANAWRTTGWTALGDSLCLRGKAFRNAFASFNGRLGRPKEAIDVALGCLLAANAAGPPRRSDGSGIGVALAPPRKSNGSGLGIACACAFNGFKRFRRFKRLGAGKRQAWTPIRSH